MKNKTIILIFFLAAVLILGILPKFIFAQDYQGAYDAQKAYDYSRRAYQSDSLEDSQYDSDRAARAAKNARDSTYTTDSATRRYSTQAYDYSRKAEQSGDLEDAQSASERAMRASDRARRSAREDEVSRRYQDAVRDNR